METETTEYIAQVTTSVQFTEDSWKIVRPSLKLTDKTTIGDIRKWMHDDLRLKNEAEFTVIKLSTVK
jgi:hypothetical protein